MARVWYSPTVTRVDVYLDDKKSDERRLRYALADYMKATGLSRNKAVKKLLQQALEDRKVFVQQKLTEYGDEFAAKLDGTHREFVSPNPKRYGTWRDCLQGEGLLTEEAVAYSKKRGWRV